MINVEQCSTIWILGLHGTFVLVSPAFSVQMWLTMLMNVYDEFKLPMHTGV